MLSSSNSSSNLLTKRGLKRRTGNTRSHATLPSVRVVKKQPRTKESRDVQRSDLKKLSSRSAPDRTGPIELPSIRAVRVNQMVKKRSPLFQSAEESDTSFSEDFRKIDDLDDGLDWYVKNIGLKNPRLNDCVKLTARVQHHTAEDNSLLELQDLRALQKIDTASSWQFAETCLQLSKRHRENENLLEAWNCLKEAVEVQEKICPFTSELAETYLSLALVAGQLGQFESAKEYYRRRCEIQECCAPNSRELVNSYQIMADFSRSEGRIGICENYMEKAFKVQEAREFLV